MFVASRRKKSARVSRQKPKSREPKQKISRSLYTKTEAKWFRDIPDKRYQRGTEQYFKEGLKNVRRVFKGFDSKDGYNLTNLKRWPHARMMEAQHYIRLYNSYTARRRKFILTRPRTAAEKEALQRFTLETFPEGKHAQKAWVIHTDSPDTARVEYARMPVQEGWRRTKVGRKIVYEPVIREGLRVELVHKVRGGRLIDRDWIFKEVLGFQPGIDFTSKALIGAQKIHLEADPYEQMVTAIRLLLPLLPDTTPTGQEAYYKILTAQFGPIGASQPKHRLIEEFRRYAETYGPKARESERLRIKRGLSTFAETIIGVRYMGSEFTALKTDAQMERSVLRERQEKQKQRQQRRRKDYEKLSRFEHRARVRWARGRIKK